LIELVDTTLRDGANAIHHGYTPEQVKAIAFELDRAGVHSIEIAHGDGLAASSIQFGRIAYPELELIEAVAGVIAHAKLAVNLQPGVATRRDMRAARAAGAAVFKVATHATEADIGLQHLELARDLDCEANGGLMMAHTVSPEVLAQQAKLMAGAGAQAVYVADSAGAMTMAEMSARVLAVRQALDDEVAVAAHCHNNLGLAVANTVVAIEAGATVADACLAGIGAGAGNCHLEALVAVLSRMGIDTAIDLRILQDASERLVRPLLPADFGLDKDSLSLGFAGVYSSFLAHAKHAAERHGVDPREVLLELGRRKIIGAQEDQIREVAASLGAALASPGLANPGPTTGERRTAALTE
jgi:4-hydroxy 2-oxovalerate aldolase